MPKKFNLLPLSRRKKDAANVAAMKSTMDKGGNYSFVKKSNVTMDVGGGKTASRRGATVTGTSTMRTSTKSEAPTMNFERGKTTKTYTPAREFTGDKRYGSEDPKNKDAAFIEKAREKRQDIAVGPDGKTYRAGYTKETKTPDKISLNIPKPKLEFERKQSVSVKEPVVAPSSGKKGANPKRKIARVEFLRNKDTVTSFERKRKKSEKGY